MECTFRDRPVNILGLNVKSEDSLGTLGSNVVSAPPLRPAKTASSGVLRAALQFVSVRHVFPAIKPLKNCRAL